MSREGVAALTGRRAEVPEGQGRGVLVEDVDDMQPAAIGDDVGVADAWMTEMAAIDPLIARSDQVARQSKAASPRGDRPTLSEDGDAGAGLEAWRSAVAATEPLPPVLAAALALDAWGTIAPLPQFAWLGRPLAAELLMRARDTTRARLPCLNLGLDALRRDGADGLKAKLEAIAAAAGDGLEEHDRLMLARRRFERRLAGRRASSKLPALVDLVVATPLASAGLNAARLKVTPQAAQDLVAELGLRELTGRGALSDIFSCRQARRFRPSAMAITAAARYLLVVIRAEPVPFEPPRAPAWARPSGSFRENSEADAVYFAGAALSTLDSVVRSDPAWAGVWRRRLALESAAAVAQNLLNRREDEAALRDAVALMRPGQALGPAGRVYAAFRTLCGQGDPFRPERLGAVAADLQAPLDPQKAAELAAALRETGGRGRPAPVAAAAAAGGLCQSNGRSSALGAARADPSGD